jgi:hypothetical protein
MKILNGILGSIIITLKGSDAGDVADNIKNTGAEYDGVSDCCLV